VLDNYLEGFVQWRVDRPVGSIGRLTLEEHDTG